MYVERNRGISSVNGGWWLRSTRVLSRWMKEISMQEATDRDKNDREESEKSADDIECFGATDRFKTID